MDIYSIRQNLAALEEIGHTLSTSERLKLEMGLLKLTEIANSDQLLFWGKIITTGQPYYVAVSLDFKHQYAFPHKKFFWSTSNMDFKQLPALDPFYQEKVDSFFHLPFSGDPNLVLINMQGQEGQQNKEKAPEKSEQDSDEQQQVKVVPKSFTELDRLSYTINSIEIECQIFPIGGFRINENHELRYNEGFRGLRLCDTSLCSFQHFKYPQSRSGKQKIEKAESIFIFDFLEPIENESQWSIQTNMSSQLVTVRNLVWQGYLAYHRLESSSFGGVYYGNGVKSVDMLFYV